MFGGTQASFVTVVVIKKVGAITGLKRCSLQVFFGALHVLYNTTNQKPRSQVVKRRRLSFFGHVARLPDDAPAKLALNEFGNTKAEKFRGSQKLTWLKQIEREVKSLDFNLEQAIEQTQNREQRQGQIERIMHMN